MNKQSISEQLEQLDYFTQKQIVLEFPSIFPECQTLPISNTRNEHYKELERYNFTFSMNEFYGGFVLALGIIVGLGQILELVL